MSVVGKVVLVTGVTTGVGRAIATMWSQRGAHLVGCGRRADLGEQLEGEIRANGGDFTFLRADVRNTADCARVVAGTVEKYGRLDVLVNNAGIEGHIAPFHTLDDEDFDSVMEINVRGTAACSRHAINQMLTQGGGLLLHIASINAIEALANMSVYNTSKAAVVQLSRSLAVEYVTQGIRSNAIALGGVEGETGSRTQDEIAAIMRGPDYVRPKEPTASDRLFIQSGEQVAAFLALLADDDASLLTGATIALDRGMTAGFMASTLVHMTTSGLWTVPEEMES